MRAFARIAAIAAVVATIPLAAGAADDIRVERVQFQRGASSAVVNGSIKGYETVDYVLGASAGQHMNVSMATDNTANYFNIMAPGEKEVAFFNGSTSENQYEGALPASGDYRVRVYMMRSAARRGEVAKYRLEMAINRVGKSAGTAAKPAVASAGAASAVKFDATGKIPCAQRRGQPTLQCDYGVARKGRGAAAVVVSLPDGRKRNITFENGRAVGADASQSDGAGAFSVTRESDLNIVRVGEERYEIPDAVVDGG